MRQLFISLICIMCMGTAFGRSYTTVFINDGLAAPLTVKTAHGTYKVTSSITLNGSVEPKHVTDGNGNWVVIGGRSYSEDGDEATITYRFSTLYDNGGSKSKSSAKSSKRSRLSKEERRERAAERRAAAINSNVFSFEQEVDLGLPSGTIWAGYNLGASSPLEEGDYYTWGAQAVAVLVCKTTIGIATTVHTASMVPPFFVQRMMPLFKSGARVGKSPA